MWGRGLACVSTLHVGLWWPGLLPADPGPVHPERRKLRVLQLVAQLLDQPGQRGETRTPGPNTARQQLRPHLLLTPLSVSTGPERDSDARERLGSEFQHEGQSHDAVLRLHLRLLHGRHAVLQIRQGHRLCQGQIITVRCVSDARVPAAVPRVCCSPCREPCEPPLSCTTSSSTRSCVAP